MKTRKPSFFKYFLPGFTDRSLEIPLSFLKHLEGDPHCGTALLKGPTGTIWRVDLKEKSGGVFIGKRGWKRFVEDNSVQVGYCLVFTYHGELRFTVKIFDTSACESHLRPYHCNISSPVCGDNGDNKRENVEGQIRGCSSYKAACSETALSELPTSKKSPPSMRRKAGGKSHFISQRRPVTAVEIERAYNAAVSFRSKNPSALVVMKKSYVYYSFSPCLPRAFIRSSLPKVSSFVTLYDPTGKNWETWYMYSERYGKGCLSTGWSSFVFSTNLEEHDVCVFELLQTKKLQVHIFRVLDDIAPLLKSPQIMA